MKDFVERWDVKRARGKTRYIILSSLFMVFVMWVGGGLINGVVDRLRAGTPSITLNFDVTVLIICVIIVVPLTFFFWSYNEKKYKRAIASQPQEEEKESTES